MAIEFECPSCNAVMRVPDAYAGKQGRCPQCGTRLLVPVVARPDLNTIPTANDQPGMQPAGQPVATPITPNAAPTTPAPAPGTRITTRKRSRRRPSRALVIGIPVIGFLLLLGIIAWSLTDKLPTLSGNLAARMLTEKTLPRIIIPWSDTGLSPDDRQTLQTLLAEKAETLSSELVTCRLIGTDDGIAVQWTAAAAAAWVVVDAVSESEKSLSLWLKKERPRLNALRRTELLDALSDYCRDKLQQATGDQVTIDAAVVRDSVALNAAVDALGYAVAAKAGRHVIRATAENEQGQLYFCVPGETQTITLAGRNSSNGLMFPGTYEVLIAPAPKTAADPAENESESETQTDSEMKTPEDTQPAPEDKFGEMLKMQPMQQ